MNINREFVIKAMSDGAKLRDLVDRNTGRTTALALAALSEAISRPGEAIAVRDHHGSHMSDVNLTHMVARMAEKLGLWGMCFDPVACTVTSHFAEPLL